MGYGLRRALPMALGEVDEFSAGGRCYCRIPCFLAFGYELVANNSTVSNRTLSVCCRTVPLVCCLRPYKIIR